MFRLQVIPEVPDLTEYALQFLVDIANNADLPRLALFNGAILIPFPPSTDKVADSLVKLAATLDENGETPLFFAVIENPEVHWVVANLDAEVVCTIPGMINASAD